MMKPGMYCTRVNEICKRHLLNPAQTLIDRLCHQPEDQRIINRDETIHGIINYFSQHLLHLCFLFVKQTAPRQEAKVQFVFWRLILILHIAPV